ncbi:hypothetical protein DFH08DRAFT_886315 [Mycena albidolilacea]|uniref:Uncharacterized protein n=1 Tax=Mycena albidolilacea TaxID=1033008 RepID=A0AAD6ZKF5_9AGAR|nr:hypothetical protein DFH08DRAFT_886315 [Mycena albidolilacea]
MASMSNTVPLLTTHNLQHEDRARLIRSTRKIGDVVGEIPHVVDPSSFTPSHPTKQKHAKLPPRSLPLPPSDARPLLYIRVPDAPPDPELPTPAPSPTLTVFLNLRSATARDDTTRRRRMAKLRRTLGANVPTDLVFPPENTNDIRYRRLTSRTLPQAPDRKSRAESKRMSIASNSSRGKRASRAQTETDPISRGWVWVGKREDIPVDVQARIKRSRMDSGLPFDWSSVDRFRNVGEEGRPTLQFRRPLHRREVGWSGEWAGAAQNMDQVVEQLRGLKVK